MAAKKIKNPTKNVHETPVFGLAAIAKYLGLHSSTVRDRYLDELLDAGVVMPRTDRSGNKGGIHRCSRWFTWPSLLQRWVMMRGGLGQHLGVTGIREPRRSKYMSTFRQPIKSRKRLAAKQKAEKANKLSNLQTELAQSPSQPVELFDDETED